MRCKSWQNSLKTAKKTPHVGSRSFDDIEFVTNRKGICDFLWVVNSNLGRISQFWSYYNLLVRNCLWDIPVLFNTLTRGFLVNMSMCLYRLIQWVTFLSKIVYAYLHSAWRGELLKSTGVAKNCEGHLIGVQGHSTTYTVPPANEDIIILCSFVLTQYRYVTYSTGSPTDREKCFS